ncbi:hypothetical protein [Rhodohalobacter sp. 8-1]|uniref:hypothetical protein n=1 Tax=Rhodohalobacter sp. 8-1 TaxID=3131972 RepID=UPI0030EC2FC2
MKKVLLALSVILLLPLILIGQPKSDGMITLTSQVSDVSSDLQNILDFKEIAYKKIKLDGDGIEGKKYRISAIDIWNGEVQDTTTIITSSELPYGRLQTIQSEPFQFDVIAEHNVDNKLKIMFNFPGFRTTKEFDAIDSEYYSLRDANLEPLTNIKSGKAFYILHYILPYEEDGTKQYCTVAQSGNDVLGWGKQFDLEHYLVFTMTIE